MYPVDSDESITATAVLAAVAMEQEQLDKASVLLENSRERRLPGLADGADG